MNPLPPTSGQAPAGFARVLVIGMGNVLMQDEGIGVRAVEELECRYVLPSEVRVVDGGTTGMALFEPMRRADALVIVDAINAQAPAGQVLRLANQDIHAFFQTKLSNHQLGLSDLLALLVLKGETPRHVAIIGMVPDQLKNCLGLSPIATHALETVLEHLVQELTALGFPPQARTLTRTGHWQRQAAEEAEEASASRPEALCV